MTHEERMAAAIELNKRIKAGEIAVQIATRDLIRTDALTQDEIDALVTIYPTWVPALSVSVGQLLAYQSTLYEVLQAHTTQADWTPDITPALFKAKAPAGVIPEWVQPTGAHDAYNTGDRVLFGGQIYESIIDANVWSPADYPAGWQLVS